MEILRQLRKNKKVTQKDVADYLGISRVAYTNYENEMRKPDFNTLSKLADYFDVTVDYMLGRTTPMNNLYAVSTKKIPVLGIINAGQPIYANQEYSEYADCDTGLNADFCLRVKGDSMINARIHDGDLVYIRKQDYVNNGEIAAVIVEGEATLKRVFFNNDQVSLVAENSKYAPLSFPVNGFDQVRILGKAIAFQSNL